MRSYFGLFRNYANFSGFLKRKPFWTAILIHCLVLLIPLIPGIFYILNKSSLLPQPLDLTVKNSWAGRYYIPWVLPLWFFWYLLTRIPITAAVVRRLHTLPRKGWWVLIGLIPGAGCFLLLIWTLQKGNYEDFEKRLGNAGLGSDVARVLNNALKMAERPRAGGWFFVVFAILAAVGFFLNRQLMKYDTTDAVLASLRESLNADRSEDRRFQDTEETEPAALQDTGAVVRLQPVDGMPIMPRKIHAESSLGADNYLYDKYGYGLLPAGNGVLASRRAVSVYDYRKCVEEGACEMPAELNTMAYRNMVTENGKAADSDHNFDEFPMVYVTRDQASAFCAWAGMRLPTADEWREAAKTSAVETWSAENANCVGTDRSEFIRTEDQLALTIPVAEFMDYASDHGMIQMTGNVWEWVTSEDGPEGTALALGGAWNSYPSNIGPDAELQTLDSYAADNIGFRCFADGSALTSDLFWGGEPVPEAEPEEPAEITDEETEAEPVEAQEIEAEEITAEEITAEEAEAVPAETGGVEILSGSIAPAESSGTEETLPEAVAEAAPADDTGVEILSGSISLSGGASSETPVPEGSSTSDDPAILIRPQDNAPMVYIPPAVFSMGISGGAIDEKPAHEVSLSGFWIDAYEVTNARYALCVAEGVCTEPRETKSFRNASYYGDPGFDNYPVIYVDWQQAQDYCRWTGSELPTEAQWEYAAKGPDGNRYPWGDTFDGTKLNYSGNGNYDTLPVDADPEDVSAFGVFDLGGNVSEWVADRYQENWYTITDQPEDPTGPETGQFRVIRGGSCQTGDNNARTADRFYAKENTFNLDRGFRCARPER